MLLHYLVSFFIFISLSAANPKYPARQFTTVTIHKETIQVKDLLGQILSNSGLEWFLDDSVSGSATVNFNNVYWEDALNLLLESQELYSRRVGELITIFPKQAAKQVKVKKSASKEVPPVINTINLEEPTFKVLGVVGSNNNKVAILSYMGTERMVKKGDPLPNGSRVSRVENIGVEVLDKDGKSKVFTF